MTAKDHLTALIEAITIAAQRRKNLSATPDTEYARAVEMAREAWGSVVTRACDAQDFLNENKENQTSNGS